MGRFTQSYAVVAVSSTAMLVAAVIAGVMLVSLHGLHDWPIGGLGLNIGGGDSGSAAKPAVDPAVALGQKEATHAAISSATATGAPTAAARSRSAAHPGGAAGPTHGGGTAAVSPSAAATPVNGPAPSAPPSAETAPPESAPVEATPAPVLPVVSPPPTETGSGGGRSQTHSVGELAPPAESSGEVPEEGTTEGEAAEGSSGEESESHEESGEGSGEAEAEEGTAGEETETGESSAGEELESAEGSSSDGRRWIGPGLGWHWDW